jgi:DNA polymerase/3'-5' exonuclease PolX
MVGIHRKVVQLAKLLQKYSPILDTVMSGMGELVGAVAGIGESVADGVNNIYEDRKRAKQKGKKYGFGDGVESFFRNSGPTPTPIKKVYGELHPRLKLKEEEF